MILDQLTIPIVPAPLAGGPSTPQLTAAVSNAGGLGFLAAGYLTAAGLAERLAQTGTLTSAPIEVNEFVPGFLDLHTAGAPAAYPEVHHLTPPLRAAGRARNDPGLVNLWAGQSYALSTELPAGQLTRTLADQARDAFLRGAKRLAI